MKKIILTIGVLVAIVCAATAQELKLAKSSGRLEIHLGRLTVEGYNGNEIVF